MKTIFDRLFKQPKYKCKCSLYNIPDGENLPKVQVHVIDLSNKDGCHSLVEGGAIHVDGGANRKDKTCHSFIHMVVFLKTTEGDGKSSRAGHKKGHISVSHKHMNWFICTGMFDLQSQHRPVLHIKEKYNINFLKRCLFDNLNSDTGLHFHVIFITFLLHSQGTLHRKERSRLFSTIKKTS